MTKILVTGGAGFIGSHLTERLVNDGHEVIVVDNLLRGNKIDKSILNKIEFHREDVRNAEAMVELSKGCHYIYHFAAVLGVDVVADSPVETMDTEVEGMRNIAEAAITNGVHKVIYASTSGVYGKSGIEQSFRENIQLDPKTSYAMAKRYNEVYLAALHEEKNLESISLRFFNVYGPKQDNRMVVPRFFEQAMHNEPLTVYGDGEQTRDFTYIEDTIEACLQLTEKVGGCDIFNIANEKETTIKEVAEKVLEITGSTAGYRLISAPKKRYDYEVERRNGSSEKLYNATGYKPQTELKEGLRKAFSHIKHEAPSG